MANKIFKWPYIVGDETLVYGRISGVAGTTAATADPDRPGNCIITYAPELANGTYDCAFYRKADGVNVDPVNDTLIGLSEPMIVENDAEITVYENVNRITEIASGAINDAHPSTSKFTTTLTGYANGFWENQALQFYTGPNAGPMRAIKGYKTNGEITINTQLPNAPGNGDAFRLVMARAFKMAGVSQQDVADSMKLAPTAGDPDVGSVNDHLDGIQAKTDNLPLSPADESSVQQLITMETEEPIEVEDDIVRNASGYKTSCSIYVYDNSAHATTHDKVTGLVRKDNITISYDANNRITLFKRIPA